MRIFSHYNYSLLKEKIRMAKRVFHSLAGLRITLHYVNVGCICGGASCVCLFSRMKRSGAVGRKEIKNVLGNTNEVSERRSRTNVLTSFEYFLQNRLHPLLGNLVVLLLGIAIALLIWKCISLLSGIEWLQ